MPEHPTQRVTRLAPSPTGALHLGNARTFLVNWALARKRGWHVVMRVEDLDGPRIRPGTETQVLDLLGWLGLDWDDGPIRQSDDLTPYRAAMGTLASIAGAFPCSLSRKEIEAAASAPQEGVGENRFPRELRPPLAPRAFDDESINWRFVCPERAIAFDDAFAGTQEHTPAGSVGDFVIWTQRGEPSYQLAVVVDDARQGVNEIVRGDDLLDSAARQILLYQALSLAPIPTYTHLPLIRGEDGRRLAKRHGDTRLVRYRQTGVGPERVVGLLAAWSGVLPRRSPEPMTAEEFRDRFDLRTMSPDPVVFDQEDERWLTESAS